MKRSRSIFLALAALFTAFSLSRAGVFAAAPFGSLEYRAIGPAIAGGRTTAVAGSDRDPLLYYAGGADGGVFKTTDGGASWKPVFDGEPAAAIGAIALRPGDPNDVWVGTGEANPRNDVAMGDGIYHSTDGGKHWTHLGLDDAGSISSISVDPRDPRVVAVGVLGQAFRDSQMRGVYLTRDGGVHWTRALFAGPSSGASDLVRVPGHPSTLFAGIYEFRRYPWTMVSGGMQGGVYRSDDDGATWRKVGGGLPEGPTGRIGLAAASGGRIYAIVESRAGELWRSDDGGTTWKKMPHSPLVGARPFYFSRIFVDPANRDRAIVVGLILSQTTDGGKTFHAISLDAGWDYHVAWWSADGRRIAVGSDEGFIMNAHGGAGGWWQPYDLPFAQAYHVGIDRGTMQYRVCIGLQDDDSWCAPGSSNNVAGVLNRDWYTVAPGDGMWTLIDPNDRNLIWSTSTNNDTGEVYLYNDRTQQVPEVSPYMRANGDEPADALLYRFNWDTPIAFEAGSTTTKVLVGGDALFESDDRGQHWSVISPDLTRNEKQHQQIPGGPIDEDMSGAETSDTILDVETTALAPQDIWVGTDDGLVQLTRDLGAHWSNVTPPQMPPWSRIAIEPSHFLAGSAYVAGDRHMMGDDAPYLFETVDGGASWHSIAGNLPKDLFVRCIREDDKRRGMLFAGTQRGVYLSFDSGRHWRPLRLNMPATAVYDMQIAEPSDDLVVGTHGRGVWILDDLRPLEAWYPRSLEKVTLYAPRTAVRSWRGAPVNTFAGSVPANAFVGENAPYGALLSYYLPGPAHDKPAIEIVDASGRVVRHLTGDGVENVAGLNRASWDLNEDGPVKWTGTFKQNQGPDEGAEAVPGVYTVRLTVDGQRYEQSLTVVADPRDPGTPEAAQARHDFLAAIFGEIGAVDGWLNAVDAKLARATPSQRSALLAFAKKLTYGPRNVEDLGGPEGLRDRLIDVTARMSTSLQPPTAAQLAAAADLKTLYERLSQEYAQLGLP